MLGKVPLFAGLDEKALSVLQQRTVTRSYPKNSIIVNEGEEAVSLYVLLSGSAKVFLSDEEGKEIIINTLAPGDHFGELALIDNAPRSASVMTTEKTQVAVITKPEFKDVVAKNPDIAFSLIQNLAKRVRILSENIKSLALLDVYGRLAKTLLSLAEEKDGRLVIDRKLTQQDLANRIGASREMVSRIMKDLATGGYISIRNKQITINETLPKAY